MSAMDGVRSSRLSAFETLAGEVIDALKTPFVCGLFEFDYGAVHEFRRRLAEERGARLSDLVVTVSAVSRVLAADPTLHTVQHRGRKLVPTTVDIGVSVAGESALAPVAVVPDAASLTVLEVHEAVRAGAAEARRREKRDQERAWLSRLVPGPLRRAALRATLSSPSVRRRLVGTFQVSSLDAFDIEAAFTPVAAAPLLMLGRAKERAVVRGGAVEVRPIVWAVIHADHRILNGATGGAFRKRLQELLDRPDALLDRPAPAP